MNVAYPLTTGALADLLNMPRADLCRCMLTGADVHPRRPKALVRHVL